MKQITYKDSGVDIDTADALVDDIKTLSRATQSNAVLSGVGGFAGLFLPNWADYKEPVLVGATDGIGTKLSLAIECGDLSGLGQDLVAMCVNDLVCTGAKPVFFLDYFATGKLEPEQLKSLIAGISAALAPLGCALLGGETAEMPGLYKTGDFDVAGFAVGIVDKAKIVDGVRDVQAHDVLIGLASSGPHSNGFSLVRKILEVKKIDARQDAPFASKAASKNLAKTLLAPTKLYVNPILQLLTRHKIAALAHITGGGLIENLPRVFGENLQAVLDSKSWTIPEVFTYLQSQGHVPDPEMWRVFNMGVGFVVIARPEAADGIIESLRQSGETAWRLGVMRAKASAQNESVVFL